MSDRLLAVFVAVLLVTVITIQYAKLTSPLPRPLPTMTPTLIPAPTLEPVPTVGRPQR